MSTERLREDVERARSDLGDTVEALADRVDSKGRMMKWVAAVIAAAATIPLAVWWWRRRAKR